ncbi:MAG: NTP transferase domain-containing protein [Myxococcota bacterium]
MMLPAIVTAGDLQAAKTVRGQSKVYLEVGGRSLVAHVVAVLQSVPEISEVWVVGDAVRLQEELCGESAKLQLHKPLHLVEQRRNLYENGWQAYRRLLAGAGPEGRDPEPSDEPLPVLFLSADLPFATPQEISAFVRQALELDCDFAAGLVEAEALQDFVKREDGRGIRTAYFNLREGRFRQSNLHLIRPARVRNRHYLEEMYEHRYQKEVGSILSLAWRLLRNEKGGFEVLAYYLLVHLAGLADRLRWVRLAGALRRFVPSDRFERGCGALLGARFRFVVTRAGGCAVDIDNERDYVVSAGNFEELWRAQRERAERIYGPLPLPPAGEVTR